LDDESDAKTRRIPKHFVRNPFEAYHRFAQAFGMRVSLPRFSESGTWGATLRAVMGLKATVKGNT
jgi:hypothetical protein